MVILWHAFFSRLFSNAPRKKKNNDLEKQIFSKNQKYAFSIFSWKCPPPAGRFWRAKKGRGIFGPAKKLKMHMFDFSTISVFQGQLIFLLFARRVRKQPRKKGVPQNYSFSKNRFYCVFLVFLFRVYCDYIQIFWSGMDFSGV